MRIGVGILKRGILPALVFILTPAIALGQSCDLLLSGGVFDRTHSLSLIDQHYVLKKFLCRDTIRTYQEAQSLDTSASIPIEGILVGFGLKADKSNFSEARDSFCRSDFTSWHDNSRYTTSLAIVSAKLVDAFNQCITNSVGAVLFILPGTDPNLFTIQINYIPPATSATVTNVVSFETRNASCQGNFKTKGVGGQPYLDVAGAIFNCTRDRKNEVQVTLALETVRPKAVGLPASKILRVEERDRTFAFHPRSTGANQFPTHCESATPGWKIQVESIPSGTRRSGGVEPPVSQRVDDYSDGKLSYALYTDRSEKNVCVLAAVRPSDRRASAGIDVDFKFKEGRAVEE